MGLIHSLRIRQQMLMRQNVFYGVKCVNISEIKDIDTVVLAVAHTEFASFTMEQMNSFFGKGTKVLLDLKGLLNRKEYEQAEYSYWRL